MPTSYSKAIGYVNISIKGKDVVVSATAPSEPKLGDLWYDTVNNRLKRWAGTEWEPENSAELSGIQETLKTHSMDIIKNAEGISQLIKDTTIVSVNGEPVSIQEAYNYSVDTATEHSQIIAETKKELADDIQTQANRTTALTQSLDGFKQEVSSTYETKTDAGTNYSALSSSITHTASSIRSEMSSAISNSETNTKTNYESYVQQTAKDINLRIDGVETKTSNNLSTAKEQIKTDYTTAIKLSKEGIEQTVSETYETKSNASSNYTSLSSSIKTASDAITTEVTRATNKENAISSSVTQNANKIGWMIKSGDSASNMLLTDRMYSVIAENINLTGKVTFSCLNSDTQSKINNAQRTADGAVTSASNAQTTANNIASNIYLSGTTTINGGKIDTDTLYAKSATFTGSLLLNGGYLTTNSSRKTYNSTVNGLTFDKNGIGGYYSSSQYFNLSKDGKLTCSGAVINGEIHATSGSFSGDISADTLTLKTGIKIASSFIDGLSSVATSGKYSDLSGTPTIPTNVNQLTGGTNIMYTSNVSVGTAVTSNGLTKKTITVNGQTFTSIESGDFILTNVGIGTDTTDNSKSYTYISKDGLLTAKNAVIYGTIYATNGSFSGTVSGATISGGTINGSSFVGGSINIGNGAFNVDSNGSVTATKGTFSGDIKLSISNTDYGLTLEPYGLDIKYRSGETFSIHGGYDGNTYENFVDIGFGSVTLMCYKNFIEVPFMKFYKTSNPDVYGYSKVLQCSEIANIKYLITGGNVESTTYYPSYSLYVNGNAYSTGGFLSGSDKELKKNIYTISRSDSCAFIYSLKPTSFIYKDNEYGREHHGFIAQEVKEAMGDKDWGVYVDPSLSNIDTSKGTVKTAHPYKALRYEEIIADLVNVVQDQHSRISQLESKIEGILQKVQSN